MTDELLFGLLGPLVESRCYPVTFPQEPEAPQWPAIRYTIVSSDPAAALCGTDDGETDDVRVQIDVVARQHKAARQLRDAAILALMNTDPPNARDPGGFEDYDPTTKTFRFVLDFVFYPSSAAV